MKFSSALNVDVSQWKSGVRMEREGASAILRAMEASSKEDSKAQTADANESKYGAGTEFMRAERDEARARRYRGRKAKLDDQPWILKVGSGKNGRSFRGIRDGGVNRNTSYYVFFQAKDGAFEAVPVSEWYKFNLLAKYKPLTAEEAEEQFEKRDKIMNFFGVMKVKKESETGDMDSSFKSKSVKREPRGSFKVSEMDDWANDSDMDSEGEGSDDDKKKSKSSKKGKGKNASKKKKKKRDSDDSDRDSEPLEESDEGDFDTLELDYNSSSSDENEDEPEEEKVVREMTGVEDLFISGSEDEDEEENAQEKDAAKVKPDPEAGEKDAAVKSKEKSGEISESSASDSDDSDLDAETSKSALFLPDKKRNESLSASNSRSQTPIRDTDNGSNSADASTRPGGVSTGSTSFSSSLPSTSGNEKSAGMKRKLDGGASGSSSARRNRPNEPEDTVTEEKVRRYLERKPMTAKELYKKFKSKISNIRSHDLVKQIAEILAKIHPEKQKIKDKGKEMTQFYLRPNK